MQILPQIEHNIYIYIIPYLSPFLRQKLHVFWTLPILRANSHRPIRKKCLQQWLSDAPTGKHPDISWCFRKLSWHSLGCKTPVNCKFTPRKTNMSAKKGTISIGNIYIFQPLIFRGHVGFLGSKLSKSIMGNMGLII